jgi:dinuclear metal center YbgI/SA1388 family protein
MGLMNVRDIMQWCESWAPLNFAQPWDRVGLLIGSGYQDVKKVCFTVNMQPAVVDEAIREQVDLMIAYHPVIWDPIRHLPAEHVVYRLAAAKIAVYCPHTAWDSGMMGLNGIVAKALQLQNCRPLSRCADFTADNSRSLKLRVFVPKEHTDAVVQSLCAAGAGIYGKYSEVHFRMAGEGRFIPGWESHPAYGERGVSTSVEEICVEVALPSSALEAVLAALFKSHPYEEPAYDIFPLKLPIGYPGIGIVGDCAEPLSEDIFLSFTKQYYKQSTVQCFGRVSERGIRRVGIAVGNASRLGHFAFSHAVDAMIVGEVDYHTSRKYSASTAPIFWVTLGHCLSERVPLQNIARRLQNRFTGLKVIMSEADRPPTRLM